MRNVFSRRFIGAALMLCAGALVAGCSGAPATIPSAAAVVPQCGLVVMGDARAPRCGTGGYLLAGTQDGYSVYRQPYSTTSTTYSGYATNADGTTEGSSSGTASSDPANGSYSVSANVPAVSSQPIPIAILDSNYYGLGTVQLPGGITLQNNGATATATFARNGVTWNLYASMDPDGQNVDVTYALSTGQTWSDKYNVALWAPSFVTSSSAERHARGFSAGAVGAVAGAVAGIAAGVAGIAAVTPGGQGVAVIAGAVAGVAGAVAGVANAVNYYEQQKAKA
jgi:hypothetical protein